MTSKKPRGNQVIRHIMSTLPEIKMISRDPNHNNNGNQQPQPPPPQVPTSGPAYLNNLGQNLLYACRNGDVGQVQQLLNHGAPYVEDWLGNSALHFAAMNGHVETCQYLISTGMKRDVRTKVDRTPLHLAAQEGHHHVVELLLKSGADRDAIDGLRMTALHWASEHSHVPVIQMLINYGANLQMRDKFERTPLTICANKEHEESCHTIYQALYGDSRTEVVLSHSGETEAVNFLGSRGALSFPVKTSTSEENTEEPFLRMQSQPQIRNGGSGTEASGSDNGIFGAAGTSGSHNNLTLPLNDSVSDMNGVQLVNGNSLAMETAATNQNISRNGASSMVEEEEDEDDDDDEEEEDGGEEEAVGSWPVRMEDEREVRNAARNVLISLERLHAEREESEVKVDGLPSDGGVRWLLNFMEMEGLTTKWVNQDKGLLSGRFISNDRVINCKIRIKARKMIFKVTLVKDELG